MKQTDPTGTTVSPTPLPSPQADSPAELSPEEVQSRLQAAARILVNGAIRVVLNQKRPKAKVPGGDEPPPTAPARKPRRIRKRASAAGAHDAVRA